MLKLFYDVQKIEKDKKISKAIVATEVNDDK